MVLYSEEVLDSQVVLNSQVFLESEKVLDSQEVLNYEEAPDSQVTLRRFLQMVLDSLVVVEPWEVPLGGSGLSDGSGPSRGSFRWF